MAVANVTTADEEPVGGGVSECVCVWRQRERTGDKERERRQVGDEDLWNWGVTERDLGEG